MSLHNFFIFTIFLLTAVGLIMVASASGFQSQFSLGSSLSLFSHQFLYGFLGGLLGFLVAYRINPFYLKKFSVLFLFVALIFLGLVLIPSIGIEHGGSRRWIDIAGFSFQPSEIGKLVLIIYAASWLSSHRKEITSFKKGFLPFLALSIVIPFLILAEPNISNFVISFLLIIILLFTAGAKFFHIASLLLVALLCVTLALFIFPARLSRIKTFLNPHTDTKGSSYQINQSLIAIGSGGFLGKGLGQSAAKKGLLPEPSGDAIFAIISEELGFIGAGSIILLYLLLAAEGFIIAVKTRDQFSQYFVLGFVSLVTLQAFINISAVSGLMPLTGVTLPFISYGSTSLIALLTASGVMARMAKEVK